MIRDEDLRSSLDYSEGQKAAAHRVLVELVRKSFSSTPAETLSESTSMRLGRSQRRKTARN